MNQRKRTFLALLVIFSLLVVGGCDILDGGEESGYTIETSVDEGGEIILTPEQEEYKEGASITVEAVPEPGYEFTGWGGALEEDAPNPYEDFVVQEDSTIVAEFTMTADTEVETVAELQETEPEDGMKVLVNGYREADDGGGGIFVFDSDNDEDSDQGMIFDSDVLDQGKWVRQLEENVIDVQWYGMESGKEECQADRLIAAMEYFFDREKEGTVYIPEGTYNVSQELSFYEGVSLEGAGIDNSVIKNIGSGYTPNALITETRHHSEDRNLGMEMTELTVDVNMYDLEEWIGAIWIEDYFKDLTIEKVRLTNSGGNIIRLARESVITDSIIDNLDGRALSTGWEEKPDLRFRDNEITNNQIIRTKEAPTEPGINLSRAENNLVKGNEVINENPPGDSYGGIRIPNLSNNNTVEDNFIKNFSRGIWILSGSQNNEVRNNTIVDSWIVSVFLNSSHEENIQTSGNIIEKNIIDQKNPELVNAGPPALIHVNEDHEKTVVDNVIRENEIRVTESYKNEFLESIEDRYENDALKDELVWLSNGAQEEGVNEVTDNVVEVEEDPFFIEIENVSQDQVYEDPVQPEVKVVDDQGNEVEDVTINMELNDEEYDGSKIDVNGGHYLTVEATVDQKTRYSDIYFELDLFSINIDGVEDGQVYQEPVTPEVNVARKGEEDVEFTEKLWLTKDDGERKEYDGEQLSDYAEYFLEVEVFQDDNEVKSEELNFEIERAEDLAIEFDGVEDKEEYNDSVTPEITIYDKETNEEVDDADIEAQLNGADFESGTPVEEMGPYVLEVEAVSGDKYGTGNLEFKIVEEEVTIYDWFMEEPDNYWDAGWTWDWEDKKTENIVHNEDPDYVKNGLSSMEIVRDGWVSDVRFTDSHKNWPDEWSEYDELSFWVYVHDPETLNTDYALVVAFDDDQDSPEEVFPASEFEAGWNKVEIDLQNIGEEDSTPGDVGFIEVILRDEHPDELNWYMDMVSLWKY